METFKIKYKGEKIDAVKTDHGGYSATLPLRKGDRGAFFTETVSRVGNGWRFSSTESVHPDYYFDVYLYDDGTTGWTNDMQNRIVKSDSKFNPSFYDKTDPVAKVCADMYEVIQGFYEHEKRGIDAEKVIGLRQAYLSSMLRMLGYSSTDRVRKEVDSDKSFKALGKIASMLERYKNLAAMFKQSRPGVYEVNIPDGMTQEELKDTIVSVANDVKSLNERMDAEEDLNQTKRAVLPTFGLTMKDDIPQEEYDVYATNVSRVAELLLELNYDIVPEMDKITLKDETGLDGLDLGDKISRVIDTKEFSEACHTEDNYVKAENERLAGEIDRLIDDSDRVIKSSVGAALDFLKRQAMISRDERNGYIEKYQEIEKLYYSKLGIKKPEDPVQDDKKVEEEEGIEPYDE